MVILLLSEQVIWMSIWNVHGTKGAIGFKICFMWVQFVQSFRSCIHRGGLCCCKVWFSIDKIMRSLLRNCFNFLYPLRLQEGFFPHFICDIDSDKESQCISGYVPLITQFLQSQKSTITVWHDKINFAMDLQTFLSEAIWFEQLYKWS